jgi:hypothetical protein
MNIIGWIGIAVCAALGWNRAPWPFHLAIGAVLGAYGAWAGFDWWRQISGEQVAMIRAGTYVASALVVTAAVYWIGRSVRSLIEKRAE